MKSKIKVLLYNVVPRKEMPSEFFVPLAYVLLEEYLKTSGIDVFRHNYILDDPTTAEFEGYQKYDLVGFQLTYSNINTVISLLKKWEEDEEKPFVVVGGVLASTIAFELIRQFSYIDVVIIGEGEEPLFQLSRAVAGEIKLEDVPGIVYRNSKRIVIYNRGKKPVDLDLTPIPKRETLHFSQEEAKKTSVRIQTARGCFGRCTFCNNSYKNKLDKSAAKVWRGMSSERMVEEVEHVYNEFNVRVINFVDPSFEDPGKKGKKRIERFANLLLDKNLRISFKVNMRAETFTDNDTNLLLLLKRAGMDIVVLGIEACTNEELKLLGKNADANTVTKAYWRLYNMDCFLVLPGYITIHPYTTLDSLRQSYDYLNELGLSYSLILFSNPLVPLRGTSLYDKILRDGLIINPGDILEVPQYRFVDCRVAEMNKGIQKLASFSVLMQLHKGIVDALNIIARSTNRMFEDTLSKHSAFLRFKYQVNEIRSQIGNRYYDLQKAMILMSEKGWKEGEFEILARRIIIEIAPVLLKQIENEIADYIRIIKNEGYDTSVLEFKSWI